MARPRLGESETERLHIKVTADELTAVDDWRYANRVPSKSEAVRRLIQIALQIEPLLSPLIRLAEDTLKESETEQFLERWHDKEELMPWLERKYSDHFRMAARVSGIAIVVDAMQKGASFDEAVENARNATTVMENILNSTLKEAEK